MELTRLRVGSKEQNASFIDEGKIESVLEKASAPDAKQVRDVIAKAGELKGLTPEETAVLLQTEDPELVGEMFACASAIKDAIYGKRLVLFAPLYFSNCCTNNCLYCGFRKDNPHTRRHLTLDDIAQETKSLVEQGHKRVLVIGGEEAGANGLKHLINVIETVYATRSGRGEIRRVNVETAPMEVEDYRELNKARIGTYVVFQETYHRGTYKAMHPGSGPKTDYDYRLLSMDRAMQGGINDVGIGVLFGLHPYKFDVLGMLYHAQHLENTYGAGPHTLSVPRIEPAEGAPASINPPAKVTDFQFKKIVAILRMAVPYTGMILSTRESPQLRAEILDLGISQMSAGSRTEPGGYSSTEQETAQFSVGDTRTLDEVIADIAQHGYVPSFCTGCYRKGRTGQDFMDLAKPGLIRLHCLPNALMTFEEYLLDYASPQTRELGEKLIATQLRDEVPDARKELLSGALDRILQGERDIYF